MARKKRRRRATGRRGSRKTYKTKTAAKRAKPKRASVYKVKGGWRVSRSRRRKRRR